MAIKKEILQIITLEDAYENYLYLTEHYEITDNGIVFKEKIAYSEFCNYMVMDIIQPMIDNAKTLKAKEEIITRCAMFVIRKAEELFTMKHLYSVSEYDKKMDVLREINTELISIYKNFKN
jgi:4-alpha-glucanotransferase